jgi:hypothetical protein
VDPLDLDSFLNPSSHGGDSTPGDHLRRDDTEDNVYALLDDRPEHDLTPPRGMDTLGGSVHGFGIDMPGLDDSFGSAVLSDEADALTLSTGARSGFAREERGAEQTPAYREPEPLTWGGEDDFGASTAPHRGDVGRSTRGDGPAATLGTRDLADEISMQSVGKVGLHSDEESRRSLRERIAQQQRERSRSSGAAPRRRTGALMLFGGLLILATVAYSFFTNDRLKEKLFGTGGDAESVAATLHPGDGRGPGVVTPRPETVQHRLRRSLAFGLPVPAQTAGAPAGGR